MIKEPCLIYRMTVVRVVAYDIAISPVVIRKIVSSVRADLIQDSKGNALIIPGNL